MPVDVSDPPPPPPPSMESSKRSSGTKRKAKPTTPWHCGVCDLSATSEALLHDHLNGKKHKAKESNLRVGNKGTKSKFWCDLCDVDCNSSGVLTRHCNGRKHKARECMVVKDRESSRGEAEVEMEIKDEEFYCGTCDVWCNGKVVMEIHLNGKKHKVKEANKEGFGDDQRLVKKRNKDLWCEICRVECNSKAMMEGHLNGKKHKVKQEKVRIYEEKGEEKEDKIKEEVCYCEGKYEDGDDQQCQIRDDKDVSDTENGIEKNELLGNEEAVIAKQNEFCGKEITAQEEAEVKKEEEVHNDGEVNKNDIYLQSKQNLFEEKRELWCLICKAKCNSRAMMNEHLKGTKHKAMEALRRGEPISETEEVKIAQKE